MGIDNWRSAIVIIMPASSPKMCGYQLKITYQLPIINYQSPISKF
ncbi:hypothetical protein [Microcoleus sp. PH2017_01_SCD_O_A]|nr:hypothetical protein [Microcoleus sp. PH2017_01_SCD_O_A]